MSRILALIFVCSVTACGGEAETTPRLSRDVAPTGLSEMEGALLVTAIDYDNGEQKVRYQLDVGNRLVEIRLVEGTTGLLSGTRVRARGRLLDDGVLEIATASSLEPVSSSMALTSESEAVLPHTFGEQRVLVLLVNFVSNPAEPWTPAAAYDTIIGPVSDFFFENSFGQTWLSAQVAGWYTLDVDPSGCPSTDILLEATAAASADGINYGAFDRIITAFPGNNCSWSGEASVGGNPSYASLDGTFDAGVITHEVGHNFGLYHSHGLFFCRPDEIEKESSVFEYGDVLDRMGNNSAGHFNAFQKRRLGWLDYGVSPTTETVDVSGTYTLEPYAQQTGGTKALRILRDIDPQNNQHRYYYLEYRQAVGFDSFLSSSRYGPSVLNGVVVRMATDADADAPYDVVSPGSSYLFDMTPQSQYHDVDDLALAVGATYTDAIGGFSLFVDSANGEGATVTVTFGGVEPPANNPPTAAFSYGCDESGCMFDAGPSGDDDGTITSYSWSFGDGSTASGVEVRHAFSTAGNFGVQLVVEDDAGVTSSASRTLPIAAVCSL